jgi:flavin-binding protein dodecin
MVGARHGSLGIPRQVFLGGPLDFGNESGVRTEALHGDGATGDILANPLPAAAIMQDRFATDPAGNATGMSCPARPGSGVEGGRTDHIHKTEVDFSSTWYHEKRLLPRSIFRLERRESMDSVYKIIDVVGTSKTSWEEAAKNAVETAGKSLEDLRVAEVVKLDLVIEKGKVVGYRSRVNISFKYRD